MQRFRGMCLGMIVAAGLLGACSSEFVAPDEQATPREAALQKKVEELKARVADLQQKVLDLTLRNQILEVQLQDGAAPAGTVAVPPTAEPQAADLTDIQLSPNPTKDQVRAYVRAIALASSWRRSCSLNDPQVRMLESVGQGNVDVLVAEMRDAGSATEQYLEWALEDLVKPEDKALIIAHLRDSPDLIEIVLDRGWTADARDVLLSALRKHPQYLPTQWISAVAALKDPTTYDDLKWYLAHGPNPSHTFDAICDLPGIDLTDAIATAWERSWRDPYTHTSMAAIAGRYGNRQALETLVQAITQPSSDPSVRDEARSALYLLTGQQSTGATLQKWFDDNKDRLTFDKAKHRWFVAGAPDEATEPTESGPSLMDRLGSFLDGDAAPDQPASTLAMLRQIKLPPNPPRDQVRDYVQKIMAVPEVSIGASEMDPQVKMLEAIGPDNVDILLDAMEGASFNDRFRAVGALKHLVRPQDKAVILAHLAALPDLALFVLRYGWSADAHDILVQGLARHPAYLPTEWIDATADLKDPAAYEDLKWYLAHGANPSWTYKSIEDLPGIELDDAVAAAWARVWPDTYSRTFMAPIAARYGDLRALDVLIQTAVLPSTEEPARRKALAEVTKLTGQTKTGPQLMAWFEENKDRLVFDRKTRVWSVSASATSGD
jgi:hypothetical protein